MRLSKKETNKIQTEAKKKGLNNHTNTHTHTHTQTQTITPNPNFSINCFNFSLFSHQNILQNYEEEEEGETYKKEKKTTGH